MVDFLVLLWYECNKSIIFAPMAKKTSTFDYKTLAGFLLPEGILDFFDVTNVEEEHTGEYAETGSEKLKLHIYLDERDTRSEEWHDLKPNGFTESREVTDFPIRDRKVILHVRRRRWTDSEGHNVVIDRYYLVAEGTSYSKEFADVLKKIYGYVPRHGMFRGADL